LLPNGASATNIAMNGTLDLNGFSQSINALTGNGIVENSGGGSAILTVGNNNASGTFSGTLQNTSGTLALDKVGSGTLTLTGTSTYSGGTTNNGSGILNSGNAAGTNYCFGTGPVVANAGTLYMTVNSWTFTNALTLNGGALRQGGGNSRLLTWSGPVGVTANSSLLSDGGTAGLAIYGDVALNSGVTLGSSAGGTAHTIYGTIGGSGSLAVSSGSLTLNGSNTFTGGLTINGGNVNSAGAEGTNYCFGTGPVVANGGSIYMVATNYIITNVLTLNGGSLRQGGAANKLLTWVGPVNVTSNSTLLSDTGTAGLAIYGNVTLANSATLSSSASGTAHTLYGTVGGTGNLTNNSGTLNLEAACNYNGTTVISGGTLRADLNGTIPNSSALTINGSGNFNVRNTNGWIYNGTITGDGTGSINLNTGTTATLAGSISGVAAINVNNTNTDTTISGNISGANTVTVQSGGGILRLTGTNSYSGATTVQTNAVLFVNGDNSGATGIVQVNEGGTLAGGGGVGGAVTVIGNVSPGTAGSAGVGSVGTLTLASTLDVSGLAVGTGKLNFDLGATNASDKIVVGSTLTLGSGLLGFSDFVFTNIGGLQNGTYKLIISSAAITDTLDGADLGGSVGAGTGTLQISGSGTDIELVVSGIGGGGPSPTLLTNSVSGGGTTLNLSWPAGQNWRLLQQTNALSKGLSTNWVDITPGSASSTNIPLDKTKPATFYRLVYP
jgi:autotransporter-associated beta strand protein